MLAAVGALSACSGGDDADAAVRASVDEAVQLAGNALTEAGATPLGAGVGGDGQTESTASTTLTQGDTIGVFAVCTGGDSLGLDLAGTAQQLDCDGRARQLDDLVLPEDEQAVFQVTDPTDGPSAWALAFAQVEGLPTP